MKTSPSIWLGIVAVWCVQFSANAVLPYSPAADPTVFEWLKADALNQANNSPVSSWTASTGASLVNSATATQPLFNTSQQNGLPAVYFNGTAFLSSSTTFSAVPQPFTAVLTFQYLDPPYATEVFLSGIPSGNDVRIENLNNNTFSIYDGGVDGTGGPPSDKNWHVAMFVFNGAGSKYRIDGGSDTAFGSNPGTKTINSICLGNLQGNTSVQPAKFNLGELILFKGDQSTNEAGIFAYLTNRWAISSGASGSTGGSTNSVTTVTGSVNMIWSPVTNAVGYSLYWGTANGSYNQMVSCPSSQTNLVATGLTPNGVYYLAVTATASDGTESPYSNQQVYTNFVGLQPPTNLHIVNP